VTRASTTKLSDRLAEYFPGVRRSDPLYVTEEGRRVWGVTAEFTDPTVVYHAAEALRDAGYKKWDLHSPFPIHGIEEAMGIKRTILPFISFAAAMSGVAFSFFMQYYTNVWDYLFVVQGKPATPDNWAWEPFVPVLFELGILFCAFATLGGMLLFNGLPRWHHPVFNSDRFLKSSDDRFVIAIDATDDNFDPETTRALLEKSGGTDIELIEDDES